VCTSNHVSTDICQPCNLVAEILNRDLAALHWVFRLYLLLLDCCCIHPALLLLLCLLLASQTVLPHTPAYDGLQACVRKDLNSLRSNPEAAAQSYGHRPQRKGASLCRQCFDETTFMITLVQINTVSLLRPYHLDRHCCSAQKTACQFGKTQHEAGKGIQVVK